MRISLLLTALFIAFLGPPVMAQEPVTAAPEADWDLIRRDDSLLAVVAYNPGLTVAVRCWRGDIDVILSQLPPSDEEWTRPISLARNGGEFRETNWMATTDPRIAFALLPTPFARDLRLGGEMQIRAAGDDGRRLRYVMALPRSPQAIETVLTACDKPLVDPRDAELTDAGLVTTTPSGRDWAKRPEPRYPDHISTSRGSATLSCTADVDGRLRDCIVESEYPRDRDFGRESLRAMRAARLTPGDPAIGPIRAAFTIRYRLEVR